MTINSQIERGVFYHIFNALADPVFVKDEQHKWIYLNDAFCHFMGFDREALLGNSDFDFFPKEQAEVFWQKDNEAFSSEQETVNEEFFTDASGVKHIISTKKSIFVHPDTKQKFLVGVIRDITDVREAENQLKKALKQLAELSNTDELTGLANRRQLHNVCDYHFQIARRNQLQIFLMYIDMDDFKIINDQYGHEEGDKAIIEVANIMKQTLRGTDVIARVGGDEFVVLFHCELIESGQLVVDRLKKAIESSNADKSRPYELSISVGLSHVSPTEDISLDILIHRADREMYQQKRRKKHI